MNTDLAFEIVDLALGIAKQQTGGKLQQDAALADSLLQIIQKAVQAYEAHTGQPLDPNLIPPEAPLG
jgi:hypothetical protein